jgi:methylmalonyl-CoA mutase cobalamin-binding domain/chain
MKNQKRYPIKIVAQRSGLSTHVIRAWEKRYNIITPLRTETNRRLYSEKDIALLTLLQKATKAGYSISSIADLDEQALKELIGPESKETERESVSLEENKNIRKADLYIDECLNAIINFDAFSLERILLRASIDLTQPTLLQELMVPLLEKIGEMWHNGTIRIMHEHLATGVIGPFLSNLRNAYRPQMQAPAFVIATPLGQIHDLGALIIAVVAASEGWRVIFLGADLPAEEIAAAAIKEKAKSIGLSIVSQTDDPLLRQELTKLRALLDSDLPIIVGGRGSDNYMDVLNQISAIAIKSIPEFRNHLALLVKTI